MNDRKLTQAQYASIRGRSKAWVSAQVKAGMPVQKRGRGKSGFEIDPSAAIDWEVEQAQASSEERKTSQRDRLAQAQADKVEMENARSAGELCFTNDVGELLNSMAADLSGRLDAVAGRIANELIGKTNPAEIRALILDEHRAVRAGMADYLDQWAESRGQGESSSIDLSSAEEADAEPVG